MTASEALPLSGATSSENVGGCFHCGLPADEPGRFELEINGVTRKFCCPACRAVCHAIHESGLEGFYERIPASRPMAPPPEPDADLSMYNLDDVQSEFIAELGEHRSINLLVEGIHCPACVWLIERSLGSLPGVLEARVNLSGRRLLLSWDNGRLHLSQVLARLGEIGYVAVPFNPELVEGNLWRRNRTLLLRMAFAGFSAMNLMWISIALYSGADDSEFRTLFHWVGFALSTPVLLFSGSPFLRNAWLGVKSLYLTMDLPIAIGAVVTWGYSVYVTVSATAVGEVYYDTVVNFLFVILVGRYLEAMFRQRAVASTQRLLDLQPRAAMVRLDGRTELRPIRAVKAGDIILIRPGERIAADGIVIEGRSGVDESMLSGESRPLMRQPSDRVRAGTVNMDSALTVKVTAILRNTALGRIIDLVERAQSSKAPIQCIADRIVPWFVGATITLAGLSFFWWLPDGQEKALMAAISVLIITCPCALGLSVPMVIASASGLAAHLGILIRDGAALERLTGVDHYIFDKTGTLTRGRPRLVEVLSLPGYDKDWLIEMAASLERYSEHSIAHAISHRAEELGLRELPVTSVENIHGRGISGTLGRRQLLLGSLRLITDRGIEVASTLQSQVADHERRGESCVHIAVDGVHVAVLVTGDPLRPDAMHLVSAIRAQGCGVSIVSGDRRPVVEAIAHELGGVELAAEVMPEDKERIVADLQRRGHVVAMIGDGVNDAPALARADVGITLGSGTDISGDSADIVLISDQLSKVMTAARLSRRAVRTIRQNIAISIMYNLAMVPLAMAALITPLIAAIAMPISSLLVIANAARLRVPLQQPRGRS